MGHFAYYKHLILIINSELSLFSGCAGPFREMEGAEWVTQL